MTTTELTWKSVGETGDIFREITAATPGWYWILRPHQAAPGQYEASTPVVCPIHVFSDGHISSPLADMRGLDEGQLAPRDVGGQRFASFFAGPIHPGSSSGGIRVERTAEGYHVDGEPPTVPGWYWCRTNTEAPLLHVDADRVGPIYLDRLEGGDIHVWSAATLGQRTEHGQAAGRPIDVGELGFAEPLTSEGGVIDASGELGRVAVEFFGAIQLPPSPSAPIWSPEAPVRAPQLILQDGETTLRVADLARARAFYEKLGFEVTQTRPEEGWACLDGGGLALRLVTGRGAAIHFASNADARAALQGLGLNPEASPDGLALTDPDGHRIVVRTAVKRSDDDGSSEPGAH